ncbi:hypothetical protein IV417_03315 [Alphaproteobacteria bacterium KMM 3653]|uniref:Uncharacterized protein n=1 Tax=Harenicola maris TaxID=2841044 RepID=A0AAP2CRK8_9RHOB|nr:hypothetical protein [Harenicola maris]
MNAQMRATGFSNPNADIASKRSGQVRKYIKITAALLGLGLAATAGYALYKIHYSHPGRFSSEVTTEGLKRIVEGTTLTSQEHPAARITFPPEYRYLGAQRFILYGTVEAEQYFFASAHPDGSTKSLINVQFEAILPEIKGTYDYSAAPRAVTIGPLDFFVDADPVRRHWLVPNGLPGTDSERYYSFTDEHGFPLPKNYIWSRFAYVPKDAPRQEMLILQAEDLAPKGLTASALRQGGANAKEWEGLLNAHLEVLEQAITIEPLR